MSTASPKPTLAFILSLPRSGSTVLSAMLDRKFGIVSPPESSFPQVLGVISKKERSDRRWLAALYHGSTFVPTPLSLDEAEDCMTSDVEETLISLGLAIASKLSRDSSAIRAIVWKTPRTVGMHSGPLATPGRFIVLRRHPHNVFESQFRVDFGKKNRNPYRFAIFRESYEYAFCQLPHERVLQVNYDELPGAISRVLEFLNIDDRGEWQSGESSLAMASKHCYHMAEVTGEFRNNDPQKRDQLDSRQVASLDLAMKLALPLRPFMRPVRAYFDHQSLGPIRERAAARLAAG